MCDQSDVTYSDGDVVWVKLGPCWWPGEVIAPDKLPPDVMPSFRKAPIAVVKFFQEETYEYVRNSNSIYMYNCSKKNEFINKGLCMYRTKHGRMDKFPEDVIRAETAVGGDIEILTRDEFQEVKKESYAGLFGKSNKRTSSSIKKGVTRSKADTSQHSTPTRKKNKEKSDYSVHILLQSARTPTSPEISSSLNSVEPKTTENKVSLQEETRGQQYFTPSTLSRPSSSTSSGLYSCHACPFSTTRLNVLIIHSKNHTASAVPTTPPVQKKSSPKQPKPLPAKLKSPKEKRSSDNTNNIEKVDKVVRKKSPVKKRTADTNLTHSEIKKVKTDEEIKNSLLADWDDCEDESNDESATNCLPVSPKVPVASESPAEPVSAELPGTEVQLERKAGSSLSPEKAEPSSDSKYDFCEDEDWHIEADAGRKIPRVKNQRKDDTKSLSLDEDEMVKEVAELLSKTAVPELPAAPEPLKIEENFPEPSIVKSPDKKNESTDEDRSTKQADNTSTKSIFKTKTFFRSRHSRSQDIIGKYVAEQLAADRMDIVESELNGSESVSSPEARESSPIEHVKLARLAPKIQLKVMNAEAANLKDIDKTSSDIIMTDSELSSETKNEDETENNKLIAVTDEDDSKTGDIELPSHSLLDVLYPTQEIKPINCEDTDKYIHSESVEHTKKEIKSYIHNKNQHLENISNNPTPINYENESTIYSKSTSSAVDALLSVSHDPDRVTKVVSDDPPENLFEEDRDIEGDISLDNSLYQNGVDEEIIVTTNPIEKLEYNNFSINGITEKPSANADVEISNDSDTITSPKFEPLEEVILESTESDIEETQLKASELLEAKESIPSESDLQIAEALINMPGTALQTTANDTDSIPSTIDLDDNSIPEEIQIIDNEVCLENIVEDKISEIDTNEKPETEEENSADTTTNLALRFETEQEKRDNLKAAQCLVQMSESLEPTIQSSDDSTQGTENSSIDDNIASECVIDESKGSDSIPEPIVLSSENSCEVTSCSSSIAETSSKLFQMLEEPQAPISTDSKTTKPELKTTSKLEAALGSERILNFDVAKASQSKSQTGKQKIIIRRAPHNKSIASSLSEMTSPDKIILSKSKATEGSSVQSYTIQTTPEPVITDASTIVIQPSPRKLSKTPPKLTKIKPQKSIHSPRKEVKSSNIITDDAMFDINSMPVLLSDDILTPESIEKMPVVMTDANITITSDTTLPTMTKVIKTKPTIVKNEKVAISSNQLIKPGIKKTLLVNQNQEHPKPTTPNILSKSAKLRGAKPMLVIDKVTGKQKIIMTKAEMVVMAETMAAPAAVQPSVSVPLKPLAPAAVKTTASAAVKPAAPANVKPAAPVAMKQTAPAVLKPAAPAAMKQTAPAAVKPEKFILLPSASSPRAGRTQKIVIDPQTGKAHMLTAKDGGSTGASAGPVGPGGAPPADAKPVAAKLLAADAGAAGGTVMIITNAQGGQSRILLTPEHEKILFPNKNVPLATHQKKVTHRITTGPTAQQKSTIVTSSPAKATRIVPKEKSAIITSKGQLIVGGRVSSGVASIAPRPVPEKKAPQKTSGEPLILLQQKSGSMLQLTPAQFQLLQRTGHLRPAGPPPRQRARPSPPDAPPAKRPRPDAPPPPPAPPAAALSELDNLEELLPVTTIQRSAAAAPAPPPPDPPALPEAQLLAVPGEHFGGPAGSFYLCVKEGGSLTPVDNRPLMLDNNQLVPMPERRDILEAALASSDVFRAEGEAPDFRDLNATVSVHCRVSETSSTLHQPIMSPAELPGAAGTAGGAGRAAAASLEAGLAQIGVAAPGVPTSLELPITVTDPRLQPPAISMPLLGDDAPPPLHTLAAPPPPPLPLVQPPMPPPPPLL